jgi:hypothetical protein
MDNTTDAFRVNDWWRSKAAMLMGMVYLFTLWFGIPFNKFLQLAALSLVTITGFAATGYLLNDFFDREKDLKAGKRNFLIGKPYIIIFFSFVISLFFLSVPWLYLPFTQLSALLIAAQLTLFVIYSLPPLRLKERGIAGIVTDALYAHTLPVLLAAYTFSLAAGIRIETAPLWALTIWQTVSGIRNILLHQHDDLTADATAESKNWVAGISTTSFYSIILYLTIAETIASILFFAILCALNTWFFICLTTIATWAIAVLFIYRGAGMTALVQSKIKHYPNNVYEKWLPPAVLLILSFVNPWFVAILLFHILLFNLEFYIESYKYTYPVVRDTWINQIRIPIRRKVSVAINYPIYFSFLLFGVDLKKENLSALDYFKKRRRQN